MAPQPLPVPPPFITARPEYLAAYNKCLHYEHVLGENARQLTVTRVLGRMMLEAPEDRGRDHLSREIISATDDDAFYKLGNLYISHFIRHFRAAKGPTPTPSDHPSRPSFDTLKWLLEEAPPDHRTAKQKALIRDKYRCMLTGFFDWMSHANDPAVRASNTTGAPRALTEAAHIFSESTNVGVSGVKEGGKKHEYAASVWAVMERFGNILIVDELNGSDIHRLENVMTMSLDAHRLFDSLNLWLESTPNVNTYRPAASNPDFLQHMPPTVTFTTSDPVNLPLPSPRYLALHAAAARVAHLSGAAEYIKTVLRDMEEMTVLARDGSSAELLAMALQGVSVH